MTYEIVTVPIPALASPNTSKFPFAKLEIGESFFVPNKDNLPDNVDISISATQANMKTHCSRHTRLKLVGEKIFKCKLWPENNQFIQVWRVS